MRSSVNRGPKLFAHAERLVAARGQRAIVWGMSIDRLQNALHRLGTAAARVEAAAAGLPIPSAADMAEIRTLVERHERLREQVRSAIGRLDTIIDGAEG